MRILQEGMSFMGCLEGCFIAEGGAQEVFGARPAPRPTLIELATVTALM